LDKIITVHELKKSYGDVLAVNGISFYVERGKVFSFLGPNGAGKSTTIDIICTFLQPDEGAVTIDGYVLGSDDESIRSVIGVVFQQSLLDPSLTVRENLRVRGSFYGLKGAALDEAVARAAAYTDVIEFIDRRYGKLSGGQRRRADVARALVNSPKILFLDEPTTGLDPQTRKLVWETIQNLRDQTGMTVFLTTHYMDEAGASDYVIVIDDGELAAKGTPLDLKKKYASDMLRLSPKDAASLEQALQENGIRYDQSFGQFHIKIPSTLDALPLLERLQPYIDGFEVVNGTMDDVFIGITGKEIRE
jgi:multidrug/hemolysin transport system ATP-binding protein